MLTLVTATSGTVRRELLQGMQDAVVRAGWQWWADTATPGLLDRLCRRTAGDQVGNDPVHALRRGLTTSLVELDQTRSGIFICVDGLLASGTAGDLVQLAAIAQHMVREQRFFGLVLAGTPRGVSDLLREPSIGFLHRAERVDLG